MRGREFMFKPLADDGRASRAVEPEVSSMRAHLPSSLAALVLASGLVTVGCTQTPTTPTTTTSLTPARSITGTWATPNPVTFVYQTDFCGAGRDVGRAQWNVTWTVTAVSGYTNVVEIEMRFTRGSTAAIGTCQPSGWVPLISPTFITACLSGTRITRCADESYKNGSVDGSFTTDLMEVTWSHWECIIYCSGEYTATNELKLTKRS